MLCLRSKFSIAKLKVKVHISSKFNMLFPLLVNVIDVNALITFPIEIIILSINFTHVKVCLFFSR